MAHRSARRSRGSSSPRPPSTSTSRAGAAWPRRANQRPCVSCVSCVSCVRACVRVRAVPCVLLRFVALLPGSKLSGTIFVLRVKTGDSGVPRVLSAVLHAYCTHYPSAENAGTEYPSTIVRSIHRIISRAHAAAAQHATCRSGFTSVSAGNATQHNTVAQARRSRSSRSSSRRPRCAPA